MSELLLELSTELDPQVIAHEQRAIARRRRREPKSSDLVWVGAAALFAVAGLAVTGVHWLWLFALFAAGLWVAGDVAERTRSHRMLQRMTGPQRHRTVRVTADGITVLDGAGQLVTELRWRDVERVTRAGAGYLLFAPARPAALYLPFAAFDPPTRRGTFEAVLARNGRPVEA